MFTYILKNCLWSLVASGYFFVKGKLIMFCSSNLNIVSEIFKTLQKWTGVDREGAVSFFLFHHCPLSQILRILFLFSLA